MPGYHKEVSKIIENNVYFQQSSDWFKHKYIFPIIERSFLVLITAVCILSSLVTIYVFMNLFPLEHKILLMTEVEDDGQSFAKIERIGSSEPNEDVDQSLMALFGQKFVEAYESYDYKDDFKKLKTNMTFIQQFTPEDIANKYKYNISINNPDSMILRYRQHTSREITPISFHLVGGTKRELDKNKIETGTYDKGGNTYTAVVDFISVEKNNNGESQTKWQARIDILYSDVKYSREEKDLSTLNLKITGYQSSEIK